MCLLCPIEIIIKNQQQQPTRIVCMRSTGSCSPLSFFYFLPFISHVSALLSTYHFVCMHCIYVFVYVCIACVSLSLGIFLLVFYSFFVIVKCRSLFVITIIQQIGGKVHIHKALQSYSKIQFNTACWSEHKQKFWNEEDFWAWNRFCLWLPFFRLLTASCSWISIEFVLIFFYYKLFISKSYRQRRNNQISIEVT